MPANYTAFLLKVLKIFSIQHVKNRTYLFCRKKTFFPVFNSLVNSTDIFLLCKKKFLHSAFSLTSISGNFFTFKMLNTCKIFSILSFFVIIDLFFILLTLCLFSADCSGIQNGHKSILKATAAETSLKHKSEGVTSLIKALKLPDNFEEIALTRSPISKGPFTYQLHHPLVSANFLPAFFCLAYGFTCS